MSDSDDNDALKDRTHAQDEQQKRFARIATARTLSAVEVALTQMQK